MLGVAAKLERRRIIERTARGRADAKAKGVKFGRKPNLTPHQQKEARARVDGRRDTAQRRPQLQRQPGDDFEARIGTDKRSGTDDDTPADPSATTSTP